MIKRIICLFLVLSVLTPNIISASDNSLPFTDVPDDYIYYDAIEYVYNNNIMNGISSTEFGCDNILNRAMLVTILYRISGCYELIEPVGFTDVPEDSFYYYAVGWGQRYGIVNGIDDTTFGPFRRVTIQQLVTFFYRFATSYKSEYYYLPEPDIIEQFLDYSSIEPFAYDGGNWAVNCGIIPSNYTYFSPNQAVSRALCAEYLYKFLTLAFGDAKALVSEDFEDCWYGETICSLLGQAGYDATAQSRLTPLSAEFALYNNDVVYIACHGMPEYIVLRGGNLTCDDIEPYSMAGFELAYISACYAGETFARCLSDVGFVNYSVGFTDEVAVHPSYLDWGSNRFDRLFFEYYTDPDTGGNVPAAIYYAKSQFNAWDLEELGLGSVIFYH